MIFELFVISKKIVEAFGLVRWFFIISKDMWGGGGGLRFRLFGGRDYTEITNLLTNAQTILSTLKLASSYGRYLFTVVKVGNIISSKIMNERKFVIYF